MCMNSINLFIWNVNWICNYRNVDIHSIEYNIFVGFCVYAIRKYDFSLKIIYYIMHYMYIYFDTL